MSTPSHSDSEIDISNYHQSKKGFRTLEYAAVQLHSVFCTPMENSGSIAYHWFWFGIVFG
jgi:hypothetical protein